MAHAESLSDDVLNVVAEQIGAMLPGVYDKEQLSGAGVEIGETFEVWVLGLDAVTQPLNDLKLSAHPRGLWHQVRLNGQPQIFARSILLGVRPSSWRVVEVFQSTLAEKIDEAITWVDLNVPDDLLTRLLVVPAYQVHAFWLLPDQGPGQVLVIDSSARLARLQSPKRLLSETEFLEALCSERPIIGRSRS
jgi:hypothetical protein